jgi:hypothetical protein
MANIYNSQLDAYALYHKSKEEQSSAYLGGPALPALGHALAGSTGTAISNLAIYPLDLVITRLQVQRQLRKSSTTPDEEEYKGVIDAFQQIYNKEGGITALYAGVLQDTGKSIADSFLFFLFYNYMRTRRLQRHGGTASSLPVLDELGVGALAGACSKFFTTPISNIVTRKQTAAMISARSGSKSAEPSVSDIAAKIRSEKGLQGFWSGYSASLVLTLNPSITFFLYEFFKRLLPRSKRDAPGARTVFLMAAISKAIASSITYPFSLAKARAQSSSTPPVNSESRSEAKEEGKKIQQAYQDSKKNVESINESSDAKQVGREEASRFKKLGQETSEQARKIARRSTVFATILEIYRTEGPAALYEGVFGEILKGFFSHGITMIVKEQIHKLIIQTYFLILKTLNKYPSPSELALQAGETIQDGAQKAGQMARDGYDNVSNRIGDLVEDGKSVAGVLGERAGVVGTNATEVAKTGYNSVSTRLGNLTQDGKEAAGVAGERVGVVGSNAAEVAKNANNLASQEAGHLLGNAQEMLSGKVEDPGKTIKSDK